MENREIARILHETAQLLEIDGAIIGRYRSYEKAAELIYSLHERIEESGKYIKNCVLLHFADLEDLSRLNRVESEQARANVRKNILYTA